MKSDISCIPIHATTKVKLIKFGKRNLAPEDCIEILIKHALTCPYFVEERS